MARRKRPAAHPNHERWLISYADFITLLLAFFVVMFASSQLDKKKAQQVSNSVAEAMDHSKDARAGAGEQRDRHANAPAASGTNTVKPETKPELTGLAQSMEHLNAALADEIGAGKLKLHLDARGLTISLLQDAYFPSGGDEIAVSEFSSLAIIARTIGALPNPVQLEGHTDSIPIHNRRFRSNWELSAARSIAMLQLFCGRYGLPESRFAVAGYAETRPVDSNGTPEGRAHNRRVDIVILSGHT